MRIARGRLTVRGGKEPWAFTLNEESQGRIAVKLTLGTGVSWCSEAPARESGNPPSTAKYDRVDRMVGLPDSPPPELCPQIPSVANVLLINLDDARVDGLELMPTVQQRLIPESVSFSNAFTPVSLCCPSRASILSGLRLVHHQVLTLTGPLGGAHRFREFGSDQQTFATWAQSQGRVTALIGKYLNSYDPSTEELGDGAMYVPPGWSTWLAAQSPEYYGGALGGAYTWVFGDGTSQQQVGFEGACVDGPCAPQDDATYRTDVEAMAIEQVIRDAHAADRRWVVYWTPSAPHVGFDLVPKPALRHDGVFAGLAPHRPPSWNEADASDKPPHVQLAPDTASVIELGDDMRLGAFDSLLAVDEGIARLLDLLESLEIADGAGGTQPMLAETAVILTSDNGVTWGEHRLFLQGKGYPYEEAQRVPLLVRMPGGTPRSVAESALTYDIAPTVAELAGVAAPAGLDGRSLVPLLQGETPAPPWRSDYCMEYVPWTPEPVLPREVPRYQGVNDVANGLKWVEYVDGVRELYDLAVDPFELDNRADDPAYAADQARLSARLAEICAP
ncbi:MAG: DUF4976 domain-containing protein [Myxococcales bacterium]|nr:MAG: DUF4976 domain-containing protein [Myxococcales bacterium]